LSYPERLGSGAPPRETLGDKSAARTAPARTSGAADARAANSEPAAPVPAAPALAAPNAPAPGAPSAPSAPSAGAPSAVPLEPSGDGYAIQLAALGKRAEAENIVKRLNDKGYSAYLIAPPSGAPAVFRVRVGKFKDRRQAESVSSRLQKEEQFKPWIVR
jgi:cell division septation protein DedD